MDPDQGTRVVEERATRNWLGRDGIVRSQIRPGIDFTVEDSVAALAAVRVLAPSLPSGVLVDCRHVRSATREARLHFESMEAGEILDAMAIFVGSPISRMIAGFFVRLVRLPFPVRTFSAEADAARWLKDVAR